MAIKVSNQLNDALKDYELAIQGSFNTKKSSRSYCTYIRAIENKMQQSDQSFTILNNWIFPQLSINKNGKNKNGEKDVTPDNKNKGAKTTWELIGKVLALFDNTFDDNTNQIGKYLKSKCRSALASFTKYVLGQYKANIYLSLELTSDLDYCRIVARNALFCTFKIAEDIREGREGSKINKEKSGNDYFSWFCCGYQRLKSKKERGTQGDIPQGMPDPQGTGKYEFDDNQKAALAIKGAVKLGFHSWLALKNTKFMDYMACHIWDKSCYDYRYHTSVFNIVLLPMSIGGLSDYSPAVKEILQYEAAMRFGVYPDGYSYVMSPATQKIYEKLDKDNEWRQPDQHQIALANIKAGMIPKALK